MWVLSILFILTYANKSPCNICRNQCMPSTPDKPLIACVMDDCKCEFNDYKSFSVYSEIDIRIFNSTITCIAKDDPNTDDCSEDCVVNLNADSIYIYNSTIYASNITLTATNIIIIDSNTLLTTQGAGCARGKGYSSKGGSYGGLGGGTCLYSNLQYSYGFYRSPAEKGSRGMLGATKDNIGGGAIHIESNVFEFYGKLNANGNMPGADATTITGGGSGGSIYIKTNKIITGSSSFISANGGNGNSYGGGGGRIAIYADKPVFNTAAFGGTAETITSTCKDAAPGTIYEEYDSKVLVGDQEVYEKSKKLIIANNKVHSENVTPITGFEDIDLLLKDGGFLITASDNFKAKSITLDDSYLAPISLGKLEIESLSITTGSFSIINGGYIGVLGFYASNPIKYIKSITIYIEYLYVDFLSGIILSENLAIKGDPHSSKVLMAGSIEGYRNNRNSHIQIYVGDLRIANEGSIFCTIIGIHADNITIQGSIQTLKNSCLDKDIIENNPQYRCVNDTASMNFLEEDELKVLMNTKNFTIYFQGAERIDLEDGSRVRGGRIGLCSKTLNITGIISAEASGCPSNTGIGAGSYQSGQCRGGGGGHGGQGGVGKSIGKKPRTECIKTAGVRYEDMNEPSYYEGSGGGVHDGIGAAGGGFIQVEAHDLSLEGSLNADGEQAPNTAQHEGAGGGSGGSIWVRTRNLAGSGIIHANGNYGTANGGHGGGGRVYLDWLGSEEDPDNMSKECSRYWHGVVEARSPKDSEYDEPFSAQDGSVSSKKCMPGYGEVYCKPCPVGYYKTEAGSEICEKCNNKPSNAHYTDLAETDSDCSYECPHSYTSEEYNSDCNSPIQEFFSSLGSLWTTCIIFFLTWAILFILNIILLLKKSIKNKSKKKHSDFLILDEDLSLANDMIILKSPHIKSSNPELIITDMPYHYHRIYLVGNNTYFSPWFLPEIPPAYLESEIDIVDYTRFAENLNKRIQWRIWEFLVYLLLLLMPPLYLMWENYRRKAKYYQLRDYIAHSTEDFWMRIELRQMSNSLRVHTTDCYTLALLDVLTMSYRKNSIFPINNPIKLMAKGDGSLVHPFKLEEEDPMLTFIKYSLRKEYLPMFEIFYREINSLFRLFEFRSSIPNKSANYIKEVIELCKVYEMILFKENNLSVTPVIFQAPHFSRFSIMKIKPEMMGSDLQERRYGRMKTYEYKPGLIFTQYKKELPVRVIVGTSYWRVNPLDEDGKELLLKSGVHCVDDPVNAATKLWQPISGFLIFRARWDLYVVSILWNFLVSLESVIIT